MTKPMFTNDEYEKLERFMRRVEVLNNVLDGIIESIVLLGLTFAICFVVLNIKGVI